MLAVLGENQESFITCLDPDLKRVPKYAVTNFEIYILQVLLFHVNKKLFIIHIFLFFFLLTNIHITIIIIIANTTTCMC